MVGEMEPCQPHIYWDLNFNRFPEERLSSRFVWNIYARILKQCKKGNFLASLDMHGSFKAFKHISEKSDRMFFYTFFLNNPLLYEE